MRVISIIIPVFNEEKNISLIYKELVGVFHGLKGAYEAEFLFINDGSKDESSQIIEELAKTDKRVKYMEFSRNFGKEIAVSAGFRFAKGNAVIMIDADLQHPPKLIPGFIEKWEKGSEIVIGIRSKNNGTTLTKKLGSKLFYNIIKRISGVEIISNATDFRLLDRIVVDELNNFTERNRMTRSLIDWLGFKRDYIHFEADSRINGNAGYSIGKLFRLAMDSIISLSLFPLKLAGYLGSFITIISGLLGLFIFIEKYIFKDPWQMHFSGSAILAVIILFLVGVILICLGLIALYIAHIHGEVLNRPMYVVRNKKI